MATRLVAVVAVAAFVLGSCGRPHVAAPRVVVLGIDGMDYRVTRDLMARGLMPNFLRLAATGSFAPLATSVPPQSPVAWSSVITGLDPGGHGIFDFIHRDPATLAPYLSTTRTEAPARAVTIGHWRFPLSNGRITLLREGRPFWDVLESQGIPATIVRMPANFPPSGAATRELSGMGTPDLLGTYGTFSFFTSSPGPRDERTPDGGRIYAVDVVDGVVSADLVGPDHPFRTSAEPLRLPFSVRIDERPDTARLIIGAEERELTVGVWSNWIPIEFPLLPLERLRGTCRVYLKQLRPVFELYVSPINLDPASPAMPISHPASFAADLAGTTGRFYTQGMPEDTKALEAGVLSRDEFLQQAALAGDEVTRQYWRTLEGFDEGFLFYYFGNLDQVSHMLWRARDPDHPAYDAAADQPYRHVVDDLYIAFDALVGKTMAELGPETRLIVMSDHGFTSWRRSFNLNSWLRERGYLSVLDASREDDPGLFQNVDWPRTRAYGLGLNGLYLNLAGREREGLVTAEERETLLKQITQDLLGTIDPATRRPAITRVYGRGEFGVTVEHAGTAPDLVIGYAAGTRVSNESALGGLTAAVFADNTLQWSGDHCMDPSAVPGVLITNRPLRRAAHSLSDLAASILAEFGIGDTR